MNPTTDKITKLKEIDELLKSGTISKDEFDKLKEEILNTQYQKPVEQKLVDEKVIIVPTEKKLDGAALGLLLLAIGGMLANGEVQIQIGIGLGVVAFFVSLYRFNTNKNLKGKKIRLIGLLLIVVNSIAYFYSKNADNPHNLDTKGLVQVLFEPEAGKTGGYGIH